MNPIVNSVVSLSAMGLVFGAGLAYASQKFAVEVDPKEAAILDALPGANCGGCGFPGCGGLATAIASGKAPVNACPVGGAQVAAAVSAIMGVEAQAGERKVARVLCNGTKTNALDKSKYSGILDCKAAAMVSGGGPKACDFGCMGMGTCEKVCPFDAIHVLEDGIAHVDPDKCVACGKCIDACPKLIIELVPVSKEVVVDCINKNKGKEVKMNCSVGCIACGICEKNCPFDAIHVVNNIARIDYSKCTSCMICVQKCPTKAIAGDVSKRKKADIVADLCIGCTICAKNCPVEAITGELKQLHVVDKDKCIGCSVCAKKCPKKAINMI
ncbi:MAG: RnfABCDGE type electron transport complex subunit B [Proteocatella sp.]